MILVFEQDQEDHDSPLMNTLKCLEGANVTLNSEKCAFRKHMLKFLGHEHGVSKKCVVFRQIRDGWQLSMYDR